MSTSSVQLAPRVRGANPTDRRLSAPVRVLIVCGLLLIASAVFHGVVYLVTGAAWEGPLSWRKPILFGFSFGITAVTVAVVAVRLRMSTRVSWALLGSLGVASVAETALITLQTWRGVPSHFNFTTAFDTTVFIAMGVVVAVVAVALAVLTIMTFTSMRPGAPSLAWSIRCGMVLLLAGQALGGAIIAAGIPAATGGELDFVFGPEGVVLGDAGILKSPHGIALHAIQVLPLIGWLAQRTTWSERRRMLAVASASVGYSAVLAASVFQAYTGQAMLVLNSPVFVVTAVGAVLVAIPAAAVGVSAARDFRGRAIRPAQA